METSGVQYKQFKFSREGSIQGTAGNYLHSSDQHESHERQEGGKLSLEEGGRRSIQPEGSGVTVAGEPRWSSATQGDR